MHYRHQTSTLKCGKELEIASNANISLVQENLHEKKVSVQLQQVRDLVKGRWKEDCTTDYVVTILISEYLCCKVRFIEAQRKWQITEKQHETTR